jgi:hypothetical protein
MNGEVYSCGNWCLCNAVLPHVIKKACSLLSFREWIRGFQDLLRQHSSSQFMPYMSVRDVGSSGTQYRSWLLHPAQ